MKQQIFRPLPLVLTITFAPSLWSEEQQTGFSIEEVIVTAQKRAESLQEIPIAMSAYNDADLEAKGAVDFGGLASTLPSLSFTPYPSASNALIMYMRGQGANDVGQITKEGAVGMYIDGVYMSRPQSVSMDLADVENIEVLRGPQGTLYGRNTTGGAVNINTRKPSGEFAFKQQLTAGNRGRLRSLSTVDLPAQGDVAAKLSYLKSQKDGYVTNIGGGNDFGEEDQQGARLALRWDVNAAISVDYAYEMGQLESTPIYYQNDLLADPGYPTKPHTRSSRAADLPRSETDFEGHALTVSWELSDTLLLKSISGYRDLDTHYYQDYLDAAFVYSYYKTDDDISSRQWSQEFQFVGTALDNRLEYVAGLYYFEESASHDQQVALLDLQDDFDPNHMTPAPFNLLFNRFVDTDNTSAAIYTQLSYTPAVLEDRLTVTVGARYTEDEREAVRDLDAVITDFAVTVPIDIAVKVDESYDSFDPMLTASYQWTNELSTYAKVVTAYKSGGFAESSADFTLSYDPEEITSYEVGLKSYWWDRHVRLNMAAFITDYEDMQLDLFPDPAKIQVVNTYNAGTAGIDGFELDLLVQPTENLQLTLDYTYLDWQIEEVIHPTTGQDIASEFSLPYAPSHAYNVGVQYTFPDFALGLLDLFVDYSWQDETFMNANTSSDPATQKLWTRDDYGLFNARLSLTVAAVTEGELRVALWGKNLEDKDYEAHRFTAGVGSAVAWAEPRTYGLDLIYEY